MIGKIFSSIATIIATLTAAVVLGTVAIIITFIGSCKFAYDVYSEVQKRNTCVNPIGAQNCDPSYNSANPKKNFYRQTVDKVANKFKPENK